MASRSDKHATGTREAAGLAASQHARPGGDASNDAYTRNRQHPTKDFSLERHAEDLTALKRGLSQEGEATKWLEAVEELIARVSHASYT